MTGVRPYRVELARPGRGPKDARTGVNRTVEPYRRLTDDVGTVRNDYVFGELSRGVRQNGAFYVDGYISGSSRRGISRPRDKCSLKTLRFSHPNTS